jgi:hypothetical protein
MVAVPAPDGTPVPGYTVPAGGDGGPSVEAWTPPELVRRLGIRAERSRRHPAAVAADEIGKLL